MHKKHKYPLFKLSNRAKSPFLHKNMPDIVKKQILLLISQHGPKENAYFGTCCYY